MNTADTTEIRDSTAADFLTLADIAALSPERQQAFDDALFACLKQAVLNFYAKAKLNPVVIFDSIMWRYVIRNEKSVNSTEEIGSAPIAVANPYSRAMQSDTCEQLKANIRQCCRRG